MEPTRQPIKRSEYLAPLSREHHDTLLFTWKIKQGLNFKTELERIVRFTTWFYEGHMKDHFNKEEKALATVLEGNELYTRMATEHEAIRNKMKEVSTAAAQDVLTELSNLVNDHVRFEERELFQYVEQNASEEQLKTLAAHLVDNKEPANYDDEFWIRTKK